jgi:hypothetical protein
MANAAKRTNLDKRSDSRPAAPGGDTTFRRGVPAYGWFKMANVFYRDFDRLSRGKHQVILLQVIWGLLVSAAKDELPEWSEWLLISDLLPLFACNAKQIREDIEDGKARGLLDYDKHGARYRFKLAYKDWPKLPDYVAPRPVPIPDPEPEPEKKKPGGDWFSRRRVLEAGDTYSFVVPSLPPDFGELKAITFRNIGDTGSLAICGGGAGQNGTVILDLADNSRKEKANEKGAGAPFFETVQSENASKQKANPGAKKGAGAPSKNHEFVANKNTYEKSRCSEVSISSVLLDACSAYGLANPDVISKMVGRCREAAPECTDEQIADRVRLKGEEVRGNPNIRNVAGIIVRSVPHWFGTAQYKTGAPDATQGPAKQGPVQESVYDRNRRGHAEMLADRARRVYQDVFGRKPGEKKAGNE